MDVGFPCAVGALLVLEDSVLAVLHSQGHLNNAVVVVVIVPLSPCFSVDLQRVRGGRLQKGCKHTGRRQSESRHVCHREAAVFEKEGAQNPRMYVYIYCMQMHIE